MPRFASVPQPAGDTVEADQQGEFALLRDWGSHGSAPHGYLPSVTSTRTRRDASGMRTPREGGGADIVRVSAPLSLELGTSSMRHPIAAALPRADAAAASSGIACFAAGTLIRTARGLVPVEALRVGDRVATFSDKAVAWRPIRWIGWRQVRPSLLPDPDSAWPVLISAGAFGRSRPTRDLRLSPEHAVAWGDGLIPARLLVNGRTILRDRQGDEITYYHIELDAHDLVLAEDLPVESWLDTGNRGVFTNAPATSQRLAFAAEAWRDRGCRPLITGGSRLAAARAALGSECDRPHLIIAGRQILPVAAGDALVFDLPPDTGWARLRSASGILAELQPGNCDQRRLGIAVAAVDVEGDSGWLRLALDGLAFGQGWHAPGPGLRWTNGDGALWLAGFRRLRLHLAAVPDWQGAFQLAG